MVAWPSLRFPAQCPPRGWVKFRTQRSAVLVLNVVIFFDLENEGARSWFLALGYDQFRPRIYVLKIFGDAKLETLGKVRLYSYFMGRSQLKGEAFLFIKHHLRKWLPLLKSFFFINLQVIENLSRKITENGKRLDDSLRTRSDILSSPLSRWYKIICDQSLAAAVSITTTRHVCEQEEGPL